MAKKAKTEELPNMEGPGIAPVRIRAIDKLAEEYVEERDKRLQQTPVEVAAKQKLVEALHKHADQLKQPDGTIVYRYDETEITLEPGKEKLRVKAFEDVEIQED